MDFELSPYMSLGSRSHNVQDMPLEELQFLDPYKPEDYDCERRVFKQDVANTRTPRQRNRSDPLADQPAQTVFTGVDVKDQCAVVALLNLKYNTNFETREGIWRPELIEELQEMGVNVQRPKFKQRPIVRKKGVDRVGGCQAKYCEGKSSMMKHIRMEPQVEVDQS